MPQSLSNSMPDAAADRTTRSGEADQLIGNYQLLSHLGSGGMGEVYRALHLNLKREVALKVLPGFGVLAPRRRQRFFVEMEALGRLDHPHIVRATDAGEWNSCPFLVMELLEGSDLRQCVVQRGPWPVAAACEAVRQAALGLQYLHEKNLIHRDIKPSNLFLTSDGVIKILDLGIARLDDATPAHPLTGSREVMGTFEYMAPEQATHCHQADIRADLYSLGGTLFFLLTGRTPFGHVADKLQAHACQPPPSLLEFVPGAPGQLNELIARLLAKKPEQRPATPAALVHALTPFVAGADLKDSRLNPATVSSAGSGQTPSEVVRNAGEAAPPLQGMSRTPLVPPAPSRTYVRGVLVKTMLVGTLAAAIVAFLAIWLGRSPPKASAPQERGQSGKRQPPTTRFDHPRTWYSLLDQDPVVLREPSGNFRWQRDDVKKELWLDTGELCLLKLGDTQAADFDLKVEFQQNQPSEGPGLFLGHQKDPVAAPWDRFLLLEVIQTRMNKNQAREPFMHAFLQSMAPERPYQAHGQMLLRDPLGAENLSRYALTVKVRKKLLASLKLNERSFDNWPARVQAGGATDLTGAFGVHVHRGSLVITRAHYQWHRSED